MVVKVYVSGISGNKEVKKRQQRVLLILDSKNVTYEVLDIAEPNMEEAKEYMQNNSKLTGATIGDPNPRHPLPPQIYNDDEYCGDYDAFDMANEIDEMEKFLKLPPSATNGSLTSNAEIKLENGDVSDRALSKESSPVKETNAADAEPATEADEEATSENKDNEAKEATPEENTDAQPQASESEKEKTPSPVKEPSQERETVGDNETDDQKAENAANGSKEDAEEGEEEKNEADKDDDVTEKSE